MPALLSPLEPLPPSPFSPFTRPASRASSTVHRVPSEEIRALAANSASGTPTRCMILYRPALPGDLPPPPSRASPIPRPSSSSLFLSDLQSLSFSSSDSKYPMGFLSDHGLIAYAYDPSVDERKPMDEEDMLHNPDVKTIKIDGPMSWRGLKNLCMLMSLVTGLLCLFIVYPVYSFYRNGSKNSRIIGNTMINATGQAVDAQLVSPRDCSQLPISVDYSIDPRTPQVATSHILPDGQTYVLVVSHEFQSEPESASLRDHQLTDVALHLPQHHPFCLSDDRGYIELNAKPPQGDRFSHFFWSGRWSTSSGDSPLDVPSEGLPSAVTISFGIPPDPLQVDYIRVYRKGQGKGVSKTGSSCINETETSSSVPSTTTISFPW